MAKKKFDGPSDAQQVTPYQAVISAMAQSTVAAALRDLGLDPENVTLEMIKKAFHQKRPNNNVVFYYFS